MKFAPDSNLYVNWLNQEIIVELTLNNTGKEDVVVRMHESNSTDNPIHLCTMPFGTGVNLIVRLESHHVISINTGSGEFEARWVAELKPKPDQVDQVV